LRLDAGGPHDIGDLRDLSSNERLELGGALPSAMTPMPVSRSRTVAVATALCTSS
jgi:hypothetical protein